MSKVDIRKLDSVTANDTTATALINENFEKLQAGIEDALSRTGKTPNFMDADLDMNSRRIINCGEAVEDNDVVTYKVVKDTISTAKDSATIAANSAAQAATSAQSAQVSSTNAINVLRNAEDTLALTSGLLEETQQYVDEAKEDINTTVVNAVQEINTTIDEAQMNLSDTIEQAVDDVKAEAVAAAEGAIQDAANTAIQIATDHANTVIKPELQTYVDSSNANATIASNSADAAMEYANSASTSATRSESAATRAETAAAQSEQATGKIVQLGFDGSIEDGILVFRHNPSGVEIPYDLLNNYEYEIDLAYPFLESLSDDLQMVVKNGNDTINFVSSLHRSSTESMKIADMKQVMRYDVDRGYRWLFKASYKDTPIGYKVFLLYPVVTNTSTLDETITGQKTFSKSIAQQMEFAYTEAPSNSRFFGYVLKDKNNETWGSFEGIKHASGTNCVQMMVKGNAGNARRMYVQETSEGVATYNYGQTVGSQWIKIPKGAGTAVLICWGNIGVADAATSKTVSFPTAFSDSPRVALTSSGGSSQVYQNVINSISSTNFKMICTGDAAEQGFHWIAVGNAAL